MDKQVSLPPAGSISGKSSFCGSPRALGASTALASTTDQNDHSSHITADSGTGRATDLRKVRMGFGQAPASLSFVEVPTSLAGRRGGSTVRDRPGVGGGHFGTNHSSLPKVQIPASTKGRASLLDLSSTDLRSSKVSGAQQRHQRQRETVM